MRLLSARARAVSSPHVIIISYTMNRLSSQVASGHPSRTANKLASQILGSQVCEEHVRRGIDHVRVAARAGQVPRQKLSTDRDILEQWRHVA
jgi:hypothetical protein